MAKDFLHKTKRLFGPRSNNTLLLGVALATVAGLAIGYRIGSLKDHPDPRYTVASQAVQDQAAKDITSQYLAESSKDCGTPTFPGQFKPETVQATFRQYLRVNKYANRAVIRECGDTDSLLAKDIHGKWVKTNVNISLDLRANPVWQVECLIDDITKPDDTIRSENSSIDVSNLVDCRNLQENELVAKILHADFDKRGIKVTQDDIDAYIRND